MASQETKVSLFSMLGNDLVKAYEEHKNDKTVKGRVDVPAGIRNGIAQLTAIEFGKVKEGKELSGKPYAFFQATILEPLEHGGVKTEGLFTSVMEMLCDTPNRKGEKSRKTLSEHLGWVMNLMAMLGADRATMNPRNLEATAAALVKKAPYIIFRTWSGGELTAEQRKDGKWIVTRDGKPTQGARTYPTKEDLMKANPYVGKEPMVNHEWLDTTTYDVGSEPSTDGMDDSSATTNGDASTFNEFQEGASPDTTVTETTEEAVTETADEAPGEVVTETTEATETADAPPPPTEDIDELVARAGAGDGEAQNALIARAIEAGASDEEIAGAEDFTAVKELIERGATPPPPPTPVAKPSPAAAMAAAKAKAGQTSGTHAGTATAVATKPPPTREPTTKPTARTFEPKVERVYLYKPLDPKTKQPAAKAVEIEVTAVDEKTKTVTAKSLVDGKTIYKGIPWDKLNMG